MSKSDESQGTVWTDIHFLTDASVFVSRAAGVINVTRPVDDVNTVDASWVHRCLMYHDGVAMTTCQLDVSIYIILSKLASAWFFLKNDRNMILKSLRCGVWRIYRDRRGLSRQKVGQTCSDRHKRHSTVQLLVPYRNGCEMFVDALQTDGRRETPLKGWWRHWQERPRLWDLRSHVVKSTSCMFEYHTWLSLYLVSIQTPGD